MLLLISGGPWDFPHERWGAGPPDLWETPAAHNDHAGAAALAVSPIASAYFR